MAFMRLFLQDDNGDYSCSHGVVFDSLPRVGTIVRAPGRPSILVKAVRPALPAREDDEQGIPAHIYAIALNETMSPVLGLDADLNPALVAA